MNHDTRIQLRSFLRPTRFTLRSAIPLLGTFGTNGIIIILNIATGAITARVLAPAGRGEFAVITLWPQFLSFATTLGIPSALIYHCKRAPDDAPGLIGSAILIASAISGAVGLTAAVLLPGVLSHYSTTVKAAAEVALLATPISAVALILTSAVQAVEDFRSYNLLRLLAPLTILVAVCGLTAVHKLTSITAACCYLLASVPVTIWNGALVLHVHRGGVRSSRSDVRRLLSYGFRYSGADFGSTLASQLDKVIVARFLTPTDVGLYSVAQSAAKLLTIVSGSVTAVLFPKASAMNGRSAIGLVARAALLSSFAVGLAGCLVILFGGQLIAFIYGHNFQRAIGGFQLLVIEAVLSVPAVILLQGFLAIGKPGLASMSQIIGIAVAVPLLIAMSLRFGLVGTAGAMAISTGTRLAFVCLGLARQYSLEQVRGIGITGATTLD